LCSLLLCIQQRHSFLVVVCECDLGHHALWVSSLHLHYLWLYSWLSCSLNVIHLCELLKHLVMMCVWSWTFSPYERSNVPREKNKNPTSST
jgi:hypothetical protein